MGYDALVQEEEAARERAEAAKKRARLEAQLETLAASAAALEEARAARRAEVTLELQRERLAKELDIQVTH